MRKIFIGIVCGLGAIIDADASIISRSFLDEALTNYATSTALDLKADKADLTTLSEIVGTPAEMTYGYVVERAMRDLFGNSYDASGVFPTNDISELIRLNYTSENFPGIRGVVHHLFVRPRNFVEGEDVWPIRLNDIFSDYSLFYDDNPNENDMFYLHDFLSDGGNLKNKTVYGLPKLTEEVNKIGTLPDGYETVGAALSAINAKIDNKIENLSETASNGKYVLTAERAGDQTTYRWEIIDRATNENSGQN